MERSLSLLTQTLTFNANALEALVSRFADNLVGFATGYTAYVKEENGTLVESVGIYSRIEKFTKQMESRLSSCVGADGAIFAVRKTLVPRSEW